MAGKISLKELCGDTGVLFYLDGYAYKQSAKPLEKLCLTNVAQEGHRFTGNLDVSGSDFAKYSYLQNIAVSGEKKETGYQLKGNIKLPLSMPGVMLTFENWQFVLSAEDKEEGVRRNTTACIMADAVFTDNPVLHGKVKQELLKDDGKPVVSLNFVDQSGSSGVEVNQCLQSFEQMLGFSFDWASFLPNGMSFQSKAKIYSITFCFSGESMSEVVQTSILFGFCNPMNSLALQAAPCSLDNVLICMGVNMKKNRELFGSICVQIKLFGQPLSIMAEYPGYRMEVNVPFDLALADAFKELKLSLPDAMKSVRLKSLYLNTALDFSDSHMMLRLADIVNLPLSGDASFRIEETDLVLKNGQEGMNVELSGLFSLYKGEARMTGFLLSAAFGKEGMKLDAVLIEKADFFEIVETLSGSPLSAGFTIVLTRMEIHAGYQGGFALHSYRAAGKLEVADAGIFGAPFSFHTGVEGNKTTTTFTGGFELENIFQINVSATLKKEHTDWNFKLVLKRLQISLSYQSDKKTLTGTIDRDFLLEDCVTYLMSLLNPQDSYAPCGDWGFLKGINLKGLTVAYSHLSKELSLSFNPTFKIPFADFSLISLVAGSAGVKFQAQGTFLGESYSEDRPLSWEPNDPPKTTGKLLQIEYLLLANSVSVDGLSPLDLPGSLKKVEESIVPGMEPSGLVWKETAGYLAALDCKIADMVECRLLYSDSACLYGASFKLYGEKAAGFAGLGAELSYGKVNDTVGVFKARFIPPALKEFKLGAMRLSLGAIEAQVYTNGNFYINIGFPENRDFSSSFAFRYGAFSGRGGLYLTQGAYGASSLLPKATNGYFDHVIGAGIGLKLELGKSFSAGILSASAILVLQGVLEGIYAVYEPQKAGNPSVPFYRLSAWVRIDGTLNGQVDFGIIGASVSLQIHTQALLTIQACEAVRVSAELEIEASAKIKVWFVTISFHFNLHYGAAFTFAEASFAPWKQNLLAQTGENENWEEKDRMPERLILPLKRMASTQKFCVKVVPVFCKKGSGYTSTLLMLADSENFGILTGLLMGVLETNEYLNKTDGMELFDNRRLLKDADFVDQMLLENITLELSFGENEETSKRSGAFLPLPEALVSTIVSEYADGAEDYLICNLKKWFSIDHDYIKKNEDYYSSSGENKKTSYRFVGEEKERSLQSQIWLDYWELLVKTIRAQKENSKRTRKKFSASNAETEQTEELAGIANAFLLGGKRAIIGKSEKESKILESAWFLSGAQQELNFRNKVARYRYELKKTPDAPDWLTLEDGKQMIDCSLDKETVRKLLPADCLPESVFSKPLSFSPAWVLEQGASITRMPMMDSGTHAYCLSGDGFIDGIIYSKEDGSPASFCILLKMNILRAHQDPALFRVIQYRNFSELENYMIFEQKPQIKTIALLYESEGQWKEWTAPECFIIKGAGMEGSNAFAPIQEKNDFLQTLFDSYEEETAVFLGFDKGKCVLPARREFEISLALHIENNGTWHRFMNGICCSSGETELTLKPGRKAYRQIVAQGNAGAQMALDFSGLTGSQEILAGLTAGAAAVIKDKNKRICGHETQPFLGRTAAGERTYSLQIPYFQSIREGQSGRYAGIPEKEPYLLSVFLLDIAGNKILPQKELSFIPKYQDELISPGAWPGIKIRYALKNGKWLFHFRGEGADQASLQEIIEQLEQPDVAIKLYGNVLAQETDCKNKALAFLKSCMADPAKEHEQTVEFGMKEFAVPSLVKISCTLAISRDETLVADDAPAHVKKIEFTIPFEQGEKKENLFKLRGENAEAEGVLFIGEESELVLTKADFMEMGEMHYFAQRPLADLSGTFGDGTEKITLEEFSLRGAIETFLEDLEWMGLSEQMTNLYMDDRKGTLLDRLYLIRTKAAEALSKHLCPVFEKTPDRVSQSARNYAKQLLANGKIRDLDDLLFYVQEGKSALSKGDWILEGTTADPEFPVYLAISQNAPCLSAAIRCGANTVDLSGTSFIPKGIYDKKDKKWFTPSTEDWKWPLSCDQKMKMPASDIPPAPVFLAKDANEGKIVLMVEICPRGQDILHMETRAKREFSEEPVEVLVFYRYVNQSFTLRQENTAASRKALLEQMEKFAQALGSYTPSIPEKSMGTMLVFGEKDGLLATVSVAGSSIKELALMRDDGEYVPMQEKEGIYNFPEAMATASGSRIRMRIAANIPDETPNRDNPLCKMALERPQKLETNIERTIERAFVLQSEAIWI